MTHCESCGHLLAEHIPGTHYVVCLHVHPSGVYCACSEGYDTRDPRLSRLIGDVA